MRTSFSPKNNPRVIIIQKLYGTFFNGDLEFSFPKHRFKKFIKDVVIGTVERNEILIDEINKTFGDEFDLKKMDKVFQVILRSSTYEILYKPNLSINIIIKEYRHFESIRIITGCSVYIYRLLQKLILYHGWIRICN